MSDEVAEAVPLAEKVPAAEVEVIRTPPPAVTVSATIPLPPEVEPRFKGTETSPEKPAPAKSAAKSAPPKSKPTPAKKTAPKAAKPAAKKVPAKKSTAKKRTPKSTAKKSPKKAGIRSGPSTGQFRAAAVKILSGRKTPLTVKELTNIAMERGLLQTVGVTPDRTMATVLYTDDTGEFVRVLPEGSEGKQRVNGVRWTVKQD